MARRVNRRSGATLLELTFALAIMATVMGVLFTLSLSIGDTARIQDVKITAVDDGQRALAQVIPRLRQAQRASINTDEMPAEVLRFRMPEDLDKNGLAVDASNGLELGAEITVRRDVNDINKDGVSATQLVMIQGETVTVLANTLSPAETAKGGGAALAGFQVDEVPGGISITIRTQGESRRGTIIRQEFTQRVEPRN